jgi:glucose/arabinose dehydrogenase
MTGWIGNALALSLAIGFTSGCGGGSSAAPNGGSTPAPSTSATMTPSPVGTSGANCTGAKVSTSTNGAAPTTPALTVPSGLAISTIAQVNGAREIVDLPNGDLLVGTSSSNVYIVPNAESGGATGAPSVFASINNETIPPGEPNGGNNPEGVAFSSATCTIFISTEFHVWSTPYRDGDLTAENLQPIATVRTGPLANPGDGDNHTSTSVAVFGSTLYASMGSSCNGCTGETDPQRAAIWRMNLNGANMQLFAKRIRNAIALAVDPATGHLWAAGAGQDDLPTWHPYEFADDVTASAGSGVADYGWPYCEENHILYNTGAGAPANCNATVQPLVEFPAYTTHIGAAFYPVNQTGPYAMPAPYRGALLVTSHGSWHTPTNGCTLPPSVSYVPMNGDTPKTAMTDWRVQQPASQYASLVSGFQPGCTNRIVRATGITVGAKGSIFVADDQSGLIYRIRP